MNPKIIISAVALLFLSGCMYGYEINTSVTKISPKTFEQANKLPEIYFDDNNMLLAEPYEQLAFIEVQGTYGSKASHLVAQLKSEGAKVGADAIINIRQHYISRESGELISEILNPDINHSYIYNTISVTGIAIKFKYNLDSL
jgi:hypothetical protein